MIKTSRFATVYVLFLVVGLYTNVHSDVAVPINKSFSEFPVRSSRWQMLSQEEFSDRVLSVLKPTDYLSRQYSGPGGHKVSLYIGYHSGGKDSGGIHSPKHCLPGTGWYETSSQRTELAVDGKKINLVKAVYQRGESREMFFYWFQVKDQSLSDEYSLKFAEITNSLLHRRRDSTFIRVSVPFETDEVQAVAVGEQFVQDFYPVIMGFLPS